MGFEVLNRRAARATGVAINITKNPKAKEGHGLSGFFRIGADVVKEAGWPEGTKVSILAGNGPDTGLFQIVPDAEGKTKPFKPKAGASLQLSFSAMSAGFTQPTEGTMEVDHKVGAGGEIVVTVPALRAGVQKKSKKSLGTE
jgi:hypothetical protein